MNKRKLFFWLMMCFLVLFFVVPERYVIKMFGLALLCAGVWMILDGKDEYDKKESFYGEGFVVTGRHAQVLATTVIILGCFCFILGLGLLVR